MNNLNNGEKLPVVISPTCLVNAYFDDAQQCMGEAFINQNQGGAGFFGGNDVSYSFYNDSLAIGIFRGICEQHIYNFQAACNYGKVFMEQYYPLPGLYTEEEFFLMNILGDPAMSMWTDIPKQLTVEHPEKIKAGKTFTLTAKDPDGNPVENALVCLWKEEMYWTGYTNSSGQITYTIPLDAPLGDMDVTVTAHNFLPYEGECTIEPGTGIVDIITTSPPLLFYANPSAKSVQIHYQIPCAGNVHIKVYDVVGRFVHQLVDEHQKSGTYVVKWDRETSNGKGASSGIYFFEIEMGDFKTVKKAVLMR